MTYASSFSTAILLAFSLRLVAAAVLAIAVVVSATSGLFIDISNEISLIGNGGWWG